MNRIKCPEVIYYCMRLNSVIVLLNYIMPQISHSWGLFCLRGTRTVKMNKVEISWYWGWILFSVFIFHICLFSVMEHLFVLCSYSSQRVFYLSFTEYCKANLGIIICWGSFSSLIFRKETKSYLFWSDFSNW